MGKRLERKVRYKASVSWVWQRGVRYGLGLVKGGGRGGQVGA